MITICVSQLCAKIMMLLKVSFYVGGRGEGCHIDIRLQRFLGGSSPMQHKAQCSIQKEKKRKMSMSQQYKYFLFTVDIKKVGQIPFPHRTCIHTWQQQTYGRCQQITPRYMTKNSTLQLFSGKLP